MAKKTFVAGTVLRAADVNEYLTGTKNILLNSRFDIWQRQTTVTPSASVLYSADRWETFRDGFVAGLSITRQTASLTGFRYCARIQRVNGNTSTANITFAQPLETVDSVKFAGGSVAFSFWARKGANLSGSVVADVRSGTGTNQNFRSGAWTGNSVVVSSTLSTLTTEWQRFTFTGVVGSTATQLGVRFTFSPTGTAGAADYFEVTGIQLEEGATATQYSQSGNNFSDELEACRRYYRKSYTQTDFAGETARFNYEVVDFPSAKTVRVQLDHGLMRVTPTIVTYNPETGATNNIRANNGTNVTMFGPYANLDSRAFYDVSAPDNGFGYFHWTADAEL